jgi:Tfp pilus assembly PilM family ATPase
MGSGRSATTIGLELDSRLLRVVWTTRRPDGNLLWGYREQSHPLGEDRRALLDGLKALLSPLRRHRLHARVLLLAPNSYLRRLTLPHAEPQLAEAIRQQAPALLPYDINDTVYAYHVEQQRATQNGVEREVIVAACERAALEQLLGALWAIGWVPSRVVPSALALLKAIKWAGLLPKGSLMLVNLAYDQTTIALVEHGRVVYARDVAIGHRHLIEALTAQASIGGRPVALTQEQAEALLRSRGFPRAGEGVPGAGAGTGPLPAAVYQATLQPILEQLVGEIRRTIHFGGEPVSAAAPQTLLFSGAGMQVPHGVEWFTHQLGMPATLLECNPMPDAPGSVSAVACGLGVSERDTGLDLQPKSGRHRMAIIRGARFLQQALLVSFAVLVLATARWSIHDQLLVRRLRALERRYNDLRPVAALREEMAGYTALIQQLVTSQAVPPPWLRQLSRDFPDPVRLNRLGVNAKGLVTMAGETQARQESPEVYVSELALWLAKHAVCHNVQLGHTRRLDEQGQMVTFSLTCQLP